MDVLADSQKKKKGFAKLKILLATDGLEGPMEFKQVSIILPTFLPKIYQHTYNV